MDKDIGAHFERIVALVRTRLTDVRVLQKDVTPQRAILQIHGKWNQFDVRIKEIYTTQRRLYSYYLLRAGSVITGFDNYPDLSALKMKFGRAYRRHLDVLIPHRHGREKKTVELTPEFSAIEFLNTLEQWIHS